MPKRTVGNGSNPFDWHSSVSSDTTNIINHLKCMGIEVESSRSATPYHKLRLHKRTEPSAVELLRFCATVTWCGYIL